MIGESEGLIRSHKRGKSPTGKYQSQPALGTKKCNKSFVMTKPEKVSERLKYSLVKKSLQDIAILPQLSQIVHCGVCCVFLYVLPKF